MFSPAAHDPELRAHAAETDGVGRVLVAPSLPLGAEAMRGEEAQPLLDAWLDASRSTAQARPTSTLCSTAAASFAASDIHRVLHAGTRPGVTIHAYSPPLWRMGADEEIGPSGELARHSISYAEELRPRSAA